MTDDTAALREQQRLWALQSFRVLDTPPQSQFDDLVRLAGRICGTSIALVSLVDRERLWFKARIGVDDVEQIPRGVDAFCCHAISQPRTFMEVEDARDDARFAGNSLVNGDLGIRFYAAMPLTSAEGEAIGTFCVLDREPRKLDDNQRQAVVALSRLTMELLHGRRRELALQRIMAERDYRLQLRQDGHKQGQDCMLVLVAIDNFKGIENSFSDEAGLRAMEAVAQVVRRNAGEEAIVSPYGNSELLVIVSDAPGADAATALERMRVQVEGLQLPFPLTVSIGAAHQPGAMDTIGPLHDQADLALAQARSNGGNCIVLLDGQRPAA